MTKEAALYQFWAGFGLPAYEETVVPTGVNAPRFPYITYQAVTDSLGNDVAMTGSIWYRSSSWIDINKKTKEISDMIGIRGMTIPIDGGVLWIRRGAPFAQSMGDESDDMIRRKLLNITAEYLTAN